MSSRGPALGLDVGSGTIGVAVSDPSGTFHFPVTTVARQGVRRDVEALVRIAADRRVVVLIVGLPTADDGSEGRSARLARQVGDALSLATGLPLHYVDERYSTVEANYRLDDASVRGERRRAVIDQAAAMVILEEWFSSQRDTGS